jgi:hypothetical protein
MIRKTKPKATARPMRSGAIRLRQRWLIRAVSRKRWKWSSPRHQNLGQIFATAAPLTAHRRRPRTCGRSRRARASTRDASAGKACPRTGSARRRKDPPDPREVDEGLRLEIERARLFRAAPDAAEARRASHATSARSRRASRPPPPAAAILFISPAHPLSCAAEGVLRTRASSSSWVPCSATRPAAST